MILTLLLIASLDEQRSAWRHRAEITAADASEPFAVLALPPVVVSASQAGGGDWRILTPEGDEVPFASLSELGIDAPHEFSGEVIDTRATPKKFSQWTADFQAPRRFDTIELGIDARDFSKIVKVEGAIDRAGPWAVLSEGTTVFDAVWNPRVHHTTIALAKPARARFVRVTFDDHTSAPVPLRGITARAQGQQNDERFSIEATLGPKQTRGDSSVYALTLPETVAFDVLTLVTTTATFSRQVMLERAGSALEKGSVYRYAHGAEAGEQLSFPVRATAMKDWQIVIVGDAAAPLKDLHVSISGAMPRLVFPRSAPGPWTLYFGNTATRAAHYDLDAFRSVLGEHPEFASAQLGATGDNPRFAAPPPLRFVATVGAPLDPSPYRLARRLTLANGEDIYSVALLPEEVAAARDDLGDVRIVDSEARQIPYVRADEWIESPLALTVTHEESAGHVDRYMLKSASPVGASALLIHVDDTTYFSRIVRVVDTDSGDRHGRRVLFESRVTRQEERQTPIRLALDGARHRALTLEIEDGDNTPLSVSAAQALVRVPRLAFKAKGAGETTLLVGNAEAAPPDYDIASLRRLVLDYAATPAEAGDSQDNPAYRRRIADYFRDAPPTLVIWGSLIALCVVLLALTARLLRKA
jgi:hypothetical protein